MKTKIETVIEGLQKKFPELKFEKQVGGDETFYTILATVKDPNHAFEFPTDKADEEGEYNIAFHVVPRQKKIICETWDMHNRTTFFDNGIGQELNNQYDSYYRLNLRNTDEAHKVYNKHRTAIKKALAELM